MMKLRSQAGMSLVEVIISLGILGVVFVGGGLKMKSVNERLNRVRASQASDALQSYLRSAMVAEENIRYSVQFLPDSTLRSCLQNGSSCRDGLEAEFPVYLVGQKQSDLPISGPSVRYTRDGELCAGAKCGPLRVTSSMRLFCTAGGSLQQACSKGRFFAIQYSIRDESRAISGNPNSGLLYQDVVEVDVRDDATYFNLSCSTGSIIHGIGLTGNALCTPLGSVSYADAGTMKPGDFNVTPKDCRPTKKETQVIMVTEKQKQTVRETITNSDGTTSEVDKEIEVEVQVEKNVEVDVPIADSDARYVESIKADGSINCANKTW